MSKNTVYHQQIKDTVRERHGDDFYRELIKRTGMNSDEAKAKKRATFKKRFGVEWNCMRPVVKEKMIAERTRPEVIERQKRTMVERYGVDCSFKIPEIHALANTPEANLKKHETMKKNGSYAISRTENAFYDWLSKKFGVEDIERPKSVNTWSVDFYIKSLDVYVLFDGEYWHGLDRPLEEISEFKTPRDESIYHRWFADRKQDEWFRERGFTLVRVTDKQFQRGEIPTCLA